MKLIPRPRSPFRQRTRLFTPIFLSLAAVVLLESTQSAVAGSIPGTFPDNKLVPVSTILSSGKWQNMLDRHREQLEDASTCQETWFTGCPLRDWGNLLRELTGADPRTQMETVNSWFNRYQYVSDRRNWRTNDFWATPLELMERGGDCEDYAIAKYLSLRLLGVSSDAMRVIVLKDKRRRRMHAVLLVDYEGQQLVLDNLYSGPVTPSEIKHYVPLYSVSESGAWRHFPRRQANQNAAGQAANSG